MTILSLVCQSCATKTPFMAVCILSRLTQILVQKTRQTRRLSTSRQRRWKLNNGSSAKYDNNVSMHMMCSLQSGDWVLPVFAMFTKNKRVVDDELHWKLLFPKIRWKAINSPTHDSQGLIPFHGTHRQHLSHRLLQNHDSFFNLGVFNWRATYSLINLRSCRPSIREETQYHPSCVYLPYSNSKCQAK